VSRDVSAWLSDLGLAHYAEAFAAADIDLDILGDLTETDLAQLGVSLGDRKRMLRALAAPPVAAAEPPERTEGERRQLTVVFCDLVGSTDLAGRLDPEDLRAVITAYHARCAEIVAQHDGTVSQFLGDGVMVEFGYPRAHEDDAERAARCALALIAGIRDLALPHGVRLVTRIGIATGTEVIGGTPGATRDRASVVGSTPSLAARLQNLAEPETAVLAAATRRLLGGTFALTPLGAHAVKGFADPIEIWRVDGEARSASRFAARRSLSSGTFVGRTQELALLQDRWELSTQGEGQVVLLSADPGIGKSRIVEEFLGRFPAPRPTRIRLQCSPHHRSSALYPVIAQLEGAARFKPGDTLAERHRKLAALVAQSPQPDASVADAFALLLALPGSDEVPRFRDLTSERRKAEIFRVFIEQLTAYARRAPVVFVIEDLHWIDPTSLELISMVVEAARHERILMIGTARPEFVCPWSHQGHLTTFALNRLSRGAVLNLVTDLCAAKALPPELIAQIVERTDGVPLFVEELTASILADDRAAIPETLRDALAARLDALAFGREIAQVGAVIGRDFSEALVLATSEQPAAAALRALDELVASGLVQRSSAPHGARYAFKHALVRDVAYDSLLRTRRQELHLRAGRAIERETPELVESEPEIVAHHLEEGGAPDDAVRYREDAAKLAISRSAYREAAEHLRRALALVPHLAGDGGQRELSLANRLGTVMLVLEGGLSKGARASFERAWAIARTHDEGPEAFNTLWGLFFGDCIGGDTAGATAKAVDLIAMAERLERMDLMLEAHHATWSAAVLRGDLQHAIDHVERGLALYDPLVHHAHVTKFGGGHDSGVCGYSQGAVALAMGGRIDEARAYAHRGLALIDRLGHPHTAALGGYLIGSALELIEDYADALRASEASAAIAREKHFELPLAAATLGAGSAWIGLGDRERGIALIAGVLDTPGSPDPVRWRPYYLARMALAQIDDGQLEGAHRSLERAEEAARGPRGAVCEGEIFRIAARLYRAQHQPVERVVERLQAARRWARDNGALLFELRATADLAALIDAGETAALARADLPSLLARFTCDPDEPALRNATAIAV